MSSSHNQSRRSNSHRHSHAPSHSSRSSRPRSRVVSNPNAAVSYFRDSSVEAADRASDEYAELYAELVRSIDRVSSSTKRSNFRADLQWLPRPHARGGLDWESELEKLASLEGSVNSARREERRQAEAAAAAARSSAGGGRSNVRWYNSRSLGDAQSGASELVSKRTAERYQI